MSTIDEKIDEIKQEAEEKINKLKEEIESEINDTVEKINYVGSEIDEFGDKKLDPFMRKHMKKIAIGIAIGGAVIVIVAIINSLF